MKTTNIDKFKVGRSVKGFYVCRSKKNLFTKNYDVYIDILLSDSTGIINAKMWNLVEEFNDRFNIGDPVAVKGKVAEYNERLQLIIDQINKATVNRYGKYGFSPEKLTPQIEESIPELWNRLITLTRQIVPPLKIIVLYIIKKYKNKIKFMQNSIEDYNSKSGSYLKKIVNSAEIANKISNYYPSLDFSLIIAGIILFDIGKIKSYTDGLLPKYTDEFSLLGYKVLGRDIILDAVKSNNLKSEDIILKLEHIVLASDLKFEDSNPNCPTFPEAQFVKHIISLNSNINRLLEKNEF